MSARDEVVAKCQQLGISSMQEDRASIVFRTPKGKLFAVNKLDAMTFPFSHERDQAWNAAHAALSLGLIYEKGSSEAVVRAVVEASPAVPTSDVDSHPDDCECEYHEQ